MLKNKAGMEFVDKSRFGPCGLRPKRRPTDFFHSALRFRPNFAASRRVSRSAHLLWIRLCASDLTVGKIVDLQGKYDAAQKQGSGGWRGENRLLEECAMQLSTAAMFCTSFVDKIVRKNFDCMTGP